MSRHRASTDLRGAVGDALRGDGSGYGPCPGTSNPKGRRRRRGRAARRRCATTSATSGARWAARCSPRRSRRPTASWRSRATCLLHTGFATRILEGSAPAPGPHRRRYPTPIRSPRRDRRLADLGVGRRQLRRRRVARQTGTESALVPAHPPVPVPPGRRWASCSTCTSWRPGSGSTDRSRFLSLPRCAIRGLRPPPCAIGCTGLNALAVRFRRAISLNTWAVPAREERRSLPDTSSRSSSSSRRTRAQLAAVVDGLVLLPSRRRADLDDVVAAVAEADEGLGGQ